MFDSSLPIKLYLGFRSDQTVPDWVSTQFCATPDVVMVRCAPFHRTYVVYESKGLYVPGQSRLLFLLMFSYCSLCCP